MHRVLHNQSGLKKNQQYLFFSFSLSVSALETLFPAELSHLRRVVLVCVVTITGRSALDGLKLI